jgi:hypothetical protein
VILDEKADFKKAAEKRGLKVFEGLQAAQQSDDDDNGEQED